MNLVNRVEILQYDASMNGAIMKVKNKDVQKSSCAPPVHLQ